MRTHHLVLLAFSPLLEDAFDFTAASHKAFIIHVLEKVFGKSLENIVCLVGDNCPTNQSLADLCNLPLVGCASHRFNLEVMKELLQYESIIAQVCHFVVFCC